MEVLDSVPLVCVILRSSMNRRNSVNLNCVTYEVLILCEVT